MRIFRELESIGELRVSADISALPNSLQCDPRFCYLSWELEVQGPNSEREVKEVFDWVDDICELSIKKYEIDEADIKTPVLVSEDSSVTVQPESIPEEVKENQENGETKSVENTVPQKVNEQDSKTAKPPQTVTKNKSEGSESASIRVSIDKVDALINMVKLLVCVQPAASVTVME